MPLHVHKKAVRALGIAESFVKGVSERSILAGVVMRADNVIDGFGFTTATVGGMDATDKIIKLHETLERDDINFILLNGCIISWYNVVDLHKVVEETQRPLLCVTYEASEGLEKYFLELFPDDWKQRVKVYHKNGSRTPLTLHTGHTVYTRFIDMTLDEAKGLLNKFTIQGAVSEPLKVSRLLARSLVKTRPQTEF
ncbi:MAG: DUF99 family protein [Candidatus Bathyarchaeia archaeon]